MAIILLKTICVPTPEHIGHDRIIGHALFQFAVVFMSAAVLYRLASAIFG